MKVLIPFIALALTCFAQDRAVMEKHLIEAEGWSNAPYTDSLGRLHVGVGHLVYGDLPISFIMRDDAVLLLFNQDLDRAIAGAERYTPNWEDQPEAVKEVLVYITFGVGANGYRRFLKVRQFIGARDYHTAARALRQSLYYRQLPKRVEVYVRVLEAQ